MGCRMSKKSKKQTSVESQDNSVCPPDLDAMKRRDLQRLCKSFNLKAIGKNVELIERLRSHYNQLELKQINNTKSEENTEDLSKVDDQVDVALNNVRLEECDENVNVNQSPDNPKPTTASNASSPKDWNWLARWCVVDGVLKQDAAERWVLLQLLGGRTVIVDPKTKERFDFVLEPTVLPTPDTYEDNYICGDCVRRNREKLSGWIGIRKSRLMETPKSSIGKENCGDDDLLRQSFKRKREEVLSPRSDFVELVVSPMKVRRLNPKSCSPASPQVRRERGEDFQLPKNLIKPWKPKKTKKTPPKEDPDYAQKVEKIITDLSPDEQRDLVFGAKSAILRSPAPHTKKV